MKHHACSFFFFALLLCAVVALPGCQQKADYKLTGLEQNKDLKKEIDDFLEDRAANVDTKDKDKDERAQRQNYQEKQIREDLIAKMASKGYYDSKVSYTSGKKPWTGTYKVDAGAQYKITSVKVTPSKYAGALKDSLKDAPLDAERVLAAQEKMMAAIAKGKCFFNLSVEHEVILDSKKKTADVHFIVNAGEQAKMGPVTFEGNEQVKSAYLQKLVKWKNGECFRRDKIEELRATLFESGLFSSAELVMADKPNKNGHVPVTMRVRERAFRSISAGATYYTDEGPGLTLGWKHRNLFGGAETLDTESKLSQRLQNISGKLVKPFFLRQDQSLSFSANMGREDTDGYIKSGIDTGVALKRTFDKHLSGTTGASLSLSRIEDETTNQTNNFVLFSLPQTLTYDTRNNVLDASRGWLLEGGVEPFFDIAGEAPPFWRTQLGARTYQRLGSKTVAALRIKAGSILGPDTIDLPATQRFYAGGGGSVRGFGYQEVGPSLNGEPQGGRSVVEASAELRFKVTETVGAVAFVDSGSVSDAVFPDLDKLSIGAGVGLRYYTSFGPLRFDVAVPLTNKETTDSSYQVYISIGQAF